MKPVLSPEINEVLSTAHYRPAISVILPFEPKMSLKTELTHALELAANKVQRQLQLQYSPMIIDPVMLRLRKLIKELNFNTHKKSIALYVSPIFEKVLYLDIPVEERVIVDDSFEIRDLIYSKKQIHKYLVLVLGGNESRMFVGNTRSFVRILSDTPQPASAFENDAPERVGNFSDPSARHEVLMEKFLRQIDNSLDLVLHAYPLPLFVLGSERMMGHFKKLTRHGHLVIDYIQGNYEQAAPEFLKHALQPFVADWSKVLQADIMHRLEEAAGSHKLAMGIKDVWQAAHQHKGHLLVVEKDYMYPTSDHEREAPVIGFNGVYHPFSYIKDAVDDIIEKVLECGGDVEFVDTGVMTGYDRIALIQYY